MKRIRRTHSAIFKTKVALESLFAYHAAMQPEMFPRKPMPGTK